MRQQRQLIPSISSKYQFTRARRHLQYEGPKRKFYDRSNGKLWKENHLKIYYLRINEIIAKVLSNEIVLLWFCVNDVKYRLLILNTFLFLLSTRFLLRCFPLFSSLDFHSNILNAQVGGNDKLACQKAMTQESIDSLPFSVVNNGCRTFTK